MGDGKIVTKISTEEALELGRLEGIKEILRELEEILQTNDPTFIKAYVKARLRSLQDATKLRIKNAKEDG